MEDRLPLPRKLVVAGLVADDTGRVLITQRPEGGPLALEWELPGGKIEPGESPQAALARELREELDLDVDVGQIWEVLHHLYPDFELLMLVYRARARPGSRPRCREVADFAWLLPGELSSHPILIADRPLVERLAATGVPEFDDALSTVRRD